MKNLLIIFIFFLSGMYLKSQAQNIPFHKGVNLTNWFQASHTGAIQFGKYGKSDFQNIQSLGCDVIRLPINLHAMTSGAPDYVPDPLFLSFLDSAVSWAEELNLHLILDNHTFDPSENTESGIESALVKVWGQMAKHYSGKYENLYYEILNEPHGIDDAIWGSIQKKAIDAIREYDKKHTIIVGGAGWNSYNNLQYIPEYSDDNLIYTFHFYDPFLFTHQGATWNTPSMDELKHIPFPYSEPEMPDLHQKYNGTWIESLHQNYSTDGTIEKVRELIDIVVDFREQRKVPVFCGEFGVYDVNSDPDDRVHWYKVVREYLEEKNIPWTSWDYHGGFGLFNKGEEGLFDHNLNTDLLESLGLKIPAQTKYEKKPDTTGFHIYDDYIQPHIEESSYGAGSISYYSTVYPNYGKYCIQWSNPDQYNIIGLDFSPDRDLSTLNASEYFLDFFIRTSSDELLLDVRFINTDTSVTEHPWRNRFTVQVQGDQSEYGWHHIRIPLSQFEEQGAWEGKWYAPEDKFQWSAIDRFEIATEHHPLLEDTVWIDQLVITNQDTSRILSSIHEPIAPTFDLNLYPNPCTNKLCLVAQEEAFPFTVKVYSVDGRVVYQNLLSASQRWIDTSSWNTGIYFLAGTFGTGKQIFERFIKN